MNIRFLSSVLLSSQMWAVVSSHARIIGGKTAEDGRFPYAVSFQDVLGHFCGGSLISRDVVLSAAHCDGIPIDKAVVGRHDLNTNEGAEVKVASTLRHPEYSDETTDNDVMLVFLEEPADESIDLVKLNSDTSYPGIDALVSVAGWGLTDVSEFEVSDVLMTVEVSTISNEECSSSKGYIEGLYGSYNGTITDNMLCARDEGEDSCQGDSGGPLVLEGLGGLADVQVGVVSWGFGCAHESFPGVYARVSSAYQWIREEVCRSSSYAPAEFECADLPTNSPTVTPAPTPLCSDTPGWTDSVGDGCGWYQVNDDPGCPNHGSYYEGSMGVANDNCCYCEGTGAPVTTPSPTSFPTYTPTVTRSPTTPFPTYSPTTTRSPVTLYPTFAYGTLWWGPTPQPTAPCTGNSPDWVDSSGDGCEWYEAHDYPGCPIHGNDFEGDMGVANDNCCFCDGTAPPAVTPSPTPFLSYLPTFSPTRFQTTADPTDSPTPTDTTPQTTSTCTGNSPDWVDVDGYGCEWWEVYDSPGCPNFGDEYGGDMGVANDNCCYCFGGTSGPTPSPTERLSG